MLAGQLTMRKTLVLLSLLMVALNCQSTQAEVTCYPSTPEFLNDPPADFPQTKLIEITSFQQMETDHGLVFPQSQGHEPLIQNFHIYTRDRKEPAITSCQSEVPRIIEFNKPVTAFGMYAENLGDLEKKVDAKFEITFADGTTGSCIFPDPDPDQPERDNPKENQWFRFFGVSSDKRIKKLIFSHTTAEGDGFRIWGLRMAR